MSQEWYYAADGDRKGPVGSADLKKLADDGKLKPTDLVWKDGMADWAPAKSIKELFGASGAAPTMEAIKAADRPPAKSAPRAEADDRPRRARRDEDEKDERPAKSRKRDDEEEERPAKARRRVEDDEEEARPSKARRPVEDDEEDERPSKSRRRIVDDEEEDERPRSRRRDEEDEEDERPRKKRRRMPADAASKKMTAILLAFFLGGLGVHKFYLGRTKEGIIQFFSNIACLAGSIIAFVEFIIYLTKSEEEFYQIYVVEEKGWF